MLTRSFIRFLLAALVSLTFALASPQAMARKSPCVAPDQSVPTNVQKNLEAEFNVHIKQLAKGEAKATVATAQEFSATVLNEDHTAKSFYLYQWCKQREAKIISNEFYEEMTRAVFSPQGHGPETKPTTPTSGSESQSLVVASAATPAQPTPPPATLAGVWTVTMTPTGINTCGSEPDLKVYTYIWTVSQDWYGTISATAQLGGSDTSFPTLQGTQIEDHVVLTSRSAFTQLVVDNVLSKVFTQNTRQWDLRVKDGEMAGIGRLVTVETTAPDNQGLRTSIGCYTEYNIEARRM